MLPTHPNHCPSLWRILSQRLALSRDIEGYVSQLTNSSAVQGPSRVFGKIITGKLRAQRVIKSAVALGSVLPSKDNEGLFAGKGAGYSPRPYDRIAAGGNFQDVIGTSGTHNQFGQRTIIYVQPKRTPGVGISTGEGAAKAVLANTCRTINQISLFALS